MHSLLAPAALALDQDPIQIFKFPPSTLLPAVYPRKELSDPEVTEYPELAPNAQLYPFPLSALRAVSYTHLRAHET